MTVAEFIAEMDKREANNEDSFNFQTAFMENYISNYAEKAKGNPIKEKVLYLLEGTLETETGQVVIYVETEEEAQKILDTAYEDIGELLLDEYLPPVQDYNDWKVDVMFGGYFCPNWEGEWEAI